MHLNNTSTSSKITIPKTIQNKTSMNFLMIMISAVSVDPAEKISASTQTGANSTTTIQTKTTFKDIILQTTASLDTCSKEKSNSNKINPKTYTLTGPKTRDKRLSRIFSRRKKNI